MRYRPETPAFSAFCAAALLTLVASGAAAQPAAAPTPSRSSPSGALSIAPLRVELPTGTDFAPMVVGNAMDRVVAVQVRIFGWNQEDGQDRYAPSTDLIASPSLFRIEPGKSQDFRVIRQNALPAGAEQRYRVVIDQLPEPASHGVQAAATRLQLLVPLFAGSDAAAPARLSAAVGDGTIILSNAGGRTARINSLAVVGPDGTKWPVASEQARYVHGSSSMTYTVAGYSCAAGPPQRVIGQTDGGDVDVVPTSSCP